MVPSGQKLQQGLDLVFISSAELNPQTQSHPRKKTAKAILVGTKFDLFQTEFDDETKEEITNKVSISLESLS